MATEATIKATPRDGTGKGANRKLRTSGRVPAVVYGHNEKTRELSLDAHELKVLFSKISVENTIIRLDIEGEKGEVKALVREVQANPVKGDLYHVDFYQIHANEKVDVEVPVHLVGSAPGVKAGGVMDHQIHELPVRCLPAAIPESLDVDVSALELGDSIHVADLKLPEGVETDMDGERTICSVVAPAVLEVSTPAEGEGTPQPERIGGAEGEGES
ncbi:MAG TPA: 50S ribosomal protein L25/general stress protein Ctc [Longimicrobiales bacterium]